MILLIFFFLSLLPEQDLKGRYRGFLWGMYRFISENQIVWLSSWFLGQYYCLVGILASWNFWNHPLIAFLMITSSVRSILNNKQYLEVRGIRLGLGIGVTSIQKFRLYFNLPFQTVYVFIICVFFALRSSSSCSILESFQNATKIIIFRHFVFISISVSFRYRQRFLFNYFIVMEYQQLCEILEISPNEDLADGFKRLFALYPDSSCPSVQLINCLLPLVMECMRTCFLENHVLVQCNQYLFVKVISYHIYCWCYVCILVCP